MPDAISLPLCLSLPAGLHSWSGVHGILLEAVRSFDSGWEKRRVKEKEEEMKEGEMEGEGERGREGEGGRERKEPHTPVFPHVPGQCPALAVAPALAAGVAEKIALGQCYSSHVHAPVHPTLPAHQPEHSTHTQNRVPTSLPSLFLSLSSHLPSPSLPLSLCNVQ